MVTFGLWDFVDRQPPTTFPKALVQAAVRRLYERGKFIGTFVFVGEHIGVCSFHCVSDSQQIKQEGLTVDGRALIHIISYPYYDMSFFLVDGEEIHQYLRLYSSDSLEQGTSAMLVLIQIYQFNYLDHISNTMLQFYCCFIFCLT